MIPVVSVASMREADEREIRRGTPSKTLMLRAGRAVASCYPFNGKTAVVCGTGNNAGDGYVIAKELHDKGKDCTVILLQDKFSDDGKYYFDICVECGVKFEYYSENTDFSLFDNIIDCIFGTGYRGRPDEKICNVFEKINDARAFTVSVDINSGINGNNGLGDCFIKSDLTVSVGTYKLGHFLSSAKDAAKKSVNVDIGIPTEPEAYVPEPSDFADFLLPRKNFSHKGTYGTVGIIGGCINYSGAVKLAASSLASLRAGCGISRIGVGKSVIPLVARQIMESTLFPISDGDEGMLFVKEELDGMMARLSSLAIGMGWGNGRNNEKILKYIIEGFNGPLVIDADGINVLSQNISLLNGKKSQIILTPHIGEMSRLTGMTTSEILKNPVEIAKTFAKEYGVTVSLKGTSTVVTDGVDCYIVNRGAAGMGTAGSGDVLSGIIVGVLGEKRENIALSVAYATYINGLAGEMAQEKYGDISMLASDTVSQIPNAVIYMRKAINKIDKKSKM